jgi:alkylhydroperoxidase/carboxymuconolactone decarboxylase family protein YurZ
MLHAITPPEFEDTNMAISWLSALKVVPWDKVIEHAPGVLDKARSLIDKHRGVATPGSASTTVQETEALPSFDELNARTLTLQKQLQEQAVVQQNMAQTMAELAEQQAGLIAMVKRLQSQLKWLIAGAVLVLTGCVVLLTMK